MPQQRAVVVTVHDIAPRTEEDVFWLLDELSSRGIARRVLAVIPNDGGQGPIPPDGPLARRLRAESAMGNEVLLHGWTHRTDGPLRGPWTDRIRGRLLARGAAELLSVSVAEARERVANGEAALGRLGLASHGYLAPGWLSPPELPATLRDAGMTHLVGFASVHDLAHDRTLAAPGIGYMGAGPVHEWLASVGGWVISASRPSAPILQVYLHPTGAHRSARCRAVLEHLPALVERLALTTYTELMGRGRADA